MSRRPDRIVDSKSPVLHCSTCGAWPATIRPRHGEAYCEECCQPKEPPKLCRGYADAVHRNDR